jgi:hypothetical protein
MGNESSNLICFPISEPNVDSPRLVESIDSYEETETQHEKKIVSFKHGSATVDEVKPPRSRGNSASENSGLGSNVSGENHSFSSGVHFGKDSLLVAHRSTLMRSRRNIVMSKRLSQDTKANLYETFSCDHCKLQIKSVNITICMCTITHPPTDSRLYRIVTHFYYPSLAPILIHLFLR